MPLKKKKATSGLFGFVVILHRDKHQSDEQQLYKVLEKIESPAVVPCHCTVNVPELVLKPVLSSI